MLCPACQHAMIIVEFRDVEVDTCPQCKGCWLDEEELGLILHGDFVPPERWTIDPVHRSSRRCPHCRARLDTGTLPGTHVDVDVCPLQHGMWLDAGELEAILKNSDTTGDAATLREYLSDVFQVPRNNTPSPAEAPS